MKRLEGAQTPTINDRAKMIKDKAIVTATLFAAPLIITAGLLEIAITSTRSGRIAKLESKGSGRSPLRPHSLKGKFRQEFERGQTVGGYVGSTDLVVEEAMMKQGSDRVARARFGGRLTRRNTKDGVQFGMDGGETVYVAHGETKSLGNDLSITFKDPDKTPTR